MTMTDDDRSHRAASNCAPSAAGQASDHASVGGRRWRSASRSPCRSTARGSTKWDGFLSLTPTTVYLFENQCLKLHISLAEPIPSPYPDVMALRSAVGEIVLPVLLVIGLATRFAGAGHCSA